MALPMIDDFATSELSIEELDAIVAGSFWSWVKKEVNAGLHWIEQPSNAATAISVVSKIISWF